MKWCDINRNHHGARAIVDRLYIGYISCPTDESVATLGVNEDGQVGMRIFADWTEVEIINGP